MIKFKTNFLSSKNVCPKLDLSKGSLPNCLANYVMADTLGLLVSFAISLWSRLSMMHVDRDAL